MGRSDRPCRHNGKCLVTRSPSLVSFLCWLKGAISGIPHEWNGIRGSACDHLPHLEGQLEFGVMGQLLHPMVANRFKRTSLERCWRDNWGRAGRELGKIERHIWSTEMKYRSSRKRKWWMESELLKRESEDEERGSAERMCWQNGETEVSAIYK